MLWRGNLLEFASEDRRNLSVATHPVRGGTATRVPRASGHGAKYVFRLAQPGASQYHLLLGVPSKALLMAWAGECNNSQSIFHKQKTQSEIAAWSPP